MKVTPIKRPIIVQVQSTEVVGVNIELTKVQALYLFHFLGSISPQDIVKSIRGSIAIYSDSEYLLEGLDCASVNKHMVDPIYDGIKEVFNMKMS